MPRLIAVLAILALLVAPSAAATLDDNADSIAIVVGNRDYRQTTPVDYARNDAAAMRDYLVRGLRFREQNVWVLNDATLNELNQAFGSEANPQGGRLWRSVIAGRSNVFVYYSGHGVPDLKTRQSFLLPHDGDPNFAESGYALETLYRNMELVKQKVGADRQVVVMVDACFTGETGRKGESLLAVSAPGFAPAKPKGGAGVIRLAATSGATPANWDDGAKLGLFTSRFLMGASGLAKSGDGPVAWADLQSYVRREVEATARRDVGREQQPEIDMASLSLPVVEPGPAIKRPFDRARDESLWRDAEADGSREALERYVASCGEPCAYRRQAMDRLLKRRQGDETLKDHETWRRLSAEGKYREYLQQCGKVCAYRPLALGYLGEDDGDAAPAEDNSAKRLLAPKPAGNEEAIAFEAAKAAGTVASLDAFVRARPDSAFATEARGLRNALSKREAERANTDAATKAKSRAKAASTEDPTVGGSAAGLFKRFDQPTDAEIRAYKMTEAEKARFRPSAQWERQMQQKLRPEYDRRLRAQGQAAANAWLASTAHAMGVRAAYEAKRQLIMEKRAAGR